MHQRISYALLSKLRHPPSAMARLRGGGKYPELRGEVLFYETRYGVFTVADVSGLPADEGACKERFFGFHVHEGEECGGTADLPFSMAGGHYNPSGCPHPAHAGDLPPLLSVRGRAFSAFLTDRFSVSEIIGKTVILHEAPDDFKTQPGGDAGARIACGVIRGT